MPMSRRVVAAAEDVQHLLRRAPRVLVHPGDLEVGDLVERLQIAQVFALDGGAIELVAQQALLEGDEERTLVVAQLGLDPVLGIQKDLAIGFPDAVVLHPVPEVDVDRRRRHGGLEVEQAALHEELHRRRRQHHARSQHARRHLDVDQEVAVQVARPTQSFAIDEEVDQRLALALAQAVAQRPRHRQPRVLVGISRARRLDHGARVVRSGREARPRLRRGRSDAQALELRDARFHVGKEAAVAKARGKVDRQQLRAGQELDVVPVPAGAQADLVEVARAVDLRPLDRLEQAEEVREAARQPGPCGQRARRALKGGETGLSVVDRRQREVGQVDPAEPGAALHDEAKLRIAETQQPREVDELGQPLVACELARKRRAFDTDRGRGLDRRADEAAGRELVLDRPRRIGRRTHQLAEQRGGDGCIDLQRLGECGRDLSDAGGIAEVRKQRAEHVVGACGEGRQRSRPDQLLHRVGRFEEGHEPGLDEVLRIGRRVGRVLTDQRHRPVDLGRREQRGEVSRRARAVGIGDEARVVRVDVGRHQRELGVDRAQRGTQRGEKAADRGLARHEGGVCSESMPQ
jgi:hypothetical protein